ncbi:MAG: hypothetical protein JWP66_1831 [Naasia sp.]|nr:hypothetical protein [Naasia sp.]
MEARRHGKERAMGAWSDEELAAVGGAEELEIASVRPDGTLRPYVIIWAARVGNGLYVRSAYGADNGWFRRAKRSGTGRIRAGGVQRDVTFAPAEPAVHPALDAEYRSKYRAHADDIVATVVGDDKADLTLRLLPRDA